MSNNKQSWPTLPDYTNATIPEIPSEYVLFGIKFRVINDIPQPEEEYKDLNIKQTKKFVDESVFCFKNLVKTMDLSFFERIKEVHIKLNDMINKAKLWEGSAVLKEMKNKKIKWKENKIKDVKSLF